MAGAWMSIHPVIWNFHRFWPISIWVSYLKIMNPKFHGLNWNWWLGVFLMFWKLPEPLLLYPNIFLKRSQNHPKSHSQQWFWSIPISSNTHVGRYIYQTQMAKKMIWPRAKPEQLVFFIREPRVKLAAGFSPLKAKLHIRSSDICNDWNASWVLLKFHPGLDAFCPTKKNI